MNLRTLFLLIFLIVPLYAFHSEKRRGMPLNSTKNVEFNINGEDEKYFKGLYEQSMIAYRTSLLKFAKFTEEKNLLPEDRHALRHIMSEHRIATYDLLNVTRKLAQQGTHSARL